MPGVDLNLPIPSIADTQTIVITKIAQALTLIEDDLTPQILPSEININSALDFGGNTALNVGYATFGGGAPSSTIPGAIYYNNGEWFLVDSIGAVQVTANGTLNLSVNGGIGGDYSAVSALVSYDNASSRYRFFGSGGLTLVDLDARNVTLNSTTRTVTLGVDAALSANKVVNFKSLPTVNIGLLAYDAASTAIVDGSTNPITAAATFNSTVTFNGAVALNAGFTHGTFTQEIPFTLGPGCNNVAIGGFDAVNVIAAAAYTWRSEPLPLRVGEKILTCLARLTRSAVANINVAIKKRNSLTGAITTIQTAAFAGATGDLTVTVGAPTAIVSRERWYIEITGGDGTSSGDSILGLQMTWNS